MFFEICLRNTKVVVAKTKTTMDRNYLQSIFVAYLVFVVSNFSQLTGGFNLNCFVNAIS